MPIRIRAGAELVDKRMGEYPMNPLKSKLLASTVVPLALALGFGMSATIVSGVVASAPAYAACAPKNPCACTKNPCAAGCVNPCAAKNPCNPCNPCAAKNPCNPCLAKNPCNPCNPCAVKNQ